jgi:hypothetical protein
MSDDDNPTAPEFGDEPPRPGDEVGPAASVNEDDYYDAEWDGPAAGLTAADGPANELTMLGRRHRRRFGPAAAVLAAVLVTAIGFYVGIRVEKSHASSSSSGFSASGLSALSSRFAGAAGGAGATSGASRAATGGTSTTGAAGGTAASSTGRSGFAGFAGRGFGAAGAGLTTGTVTRVSGDTLYVKESDGKTVKVEVLPDTTLSKTFPVSSSSVDPGDTVTLQGTAGSGGTFTATSLSDSGNDSTASTSSSSATTGAAGAAGGAGRFAQLLAARGF